MFTAFPASAAVVGGGVIATVMQLAGHAGGNTPELAAGDPNHPVAGKTDPADLLAFLPHRRNL